jgi:hypothetical protein
MRATGRPPTVSHACSQSRSRSDDRSLSPEHDDRREVEQRSPTPERAPERRAGAQSTTAEVRVAYGSPIVLCELVMTRLTGWAPCPGGNWKLQCMLRRSFVYSTKGVARAELEMQCSERNLVLADDVPAAAPDELKFDWKVRTCARSIAMLRGLSMPTTASTTCRPRFGAAISRHPGPAYRLAALKQLAQQILSTAAPSTAAHQHLRRFTICLYFRHIPQRPQLQRPERP